MKKFLAIALVLALVLSMSACGKKKYEPLDPPKNPSEVGMANPWQDCNSLEHAAQITGFDFSVPEDLGDYDNKLIQALRDGSEVQVICYNTNESGDTNVDGLIIRKAKGADQDISGVYGDFDTKEEKVDGRTVTLKNEDGKVALALWSEGDFSYSVYTYPSVDKETMLDMVKGVK